MSRYIDADKMLEICTKYVASVFPNSYEFAKQDAELLVAIEEAEHKTIDIVRCKECKHWCKGDEVYGICNRCANTRQMRHDDFCSYGVKKGADDE